MKIVQFENGKYGIRRFNFVFFNYEFLKRKATGYGFIWFGDDDLGFVHKYCTYDTYEEACELMQEFKGVIPPKHNFDIGKPVVDKKC